MSVPLPDGGGDPPVEDVPSGATFDVEEFRRRNVSAVAMDVLYLVTTAFFAVLAVKGFWPAVMAALPLATLLYFAWKSSTSFLVANVVVIGLTAFATFAGLVPF